MQEESFLKNIELKTQFSANLTEEERRASLKELEERSIKRDYDVSEIHLSSEQREYVVHALEFIRHKLESLGLTEAATLMPDLNQIQFVRFDRFGSDINGYVDPAGVKITMIIPSSYEVTDRRVIEVLSHEVSHFISKVIISRGAEGLKTQGLGFQRDFYPPTQSPDDYSWVSKGVYEEPCAILFTMYCNDDRINENRSFICDNYGRQVGFMFPMLKAYAARTGTTPLDAFKQLMLAKVRRDFGFQKKMVDVFGTDFVKGINNLVAISTEENQITPKATYEALAEKGGFKDEYVKTRKNIDDFETVEYPGIKTKALVIDTLSD